MYYRSDYSDERKLAEIRELCEKEEFDDLLEDLKPNGVKSLFAAWLLKNGLFNQYHRMCLRLYRSQNKVITNTPDESTPDEPYRALNIYSDINVQEDSSAENKKAGALTDEDTCKSEINDLKKEDAVDTDLITEALEKSAESMAKGRADGRLKQESSNNRSRKNTSVTMEDILKVRDILSEKKC